MVLRQTKNDMSAGFVAIYQVYLLNRATNKLTKVSRHNPECQVFATGSRRGESHDGTSFSDIPTARADTTDGATENEILGTVSYQGIHASWSTNPLVSELAVAVVCGALNGEGHRANHQSPFDSDLVHDRTSHEAGWAFVLVSSQ